MKPLTIEELKALSIEDWLWIIDLKEGTGSYKQISDICEEENWMWFEEDCQASHYSDYGKSWVAYKNKENVCPHRVCVFSECENQNYCMANAISLLKEAEQDIESLKKNPLTSLTKSELKYYIDLLKGFIKYIEPKETNGGVMEAIDGIKEFISRISKEG